MALSPAALAELFTRDGGDPFIYLLTVAGADLPGGTLRLARNSEDITSRGQVFAASWFEPVLPASSEEQPVASITIPNVDGEVGRAILEVSSAITCTIEVIRPALPDQVEFRAAMLKLRTVKIDPLTVTGQLSVVDLSREPYGNLRVVPANFPWLNYV